ncbi:MAG: SRPBCC family protein [Solirubrobacteraceae bacterium]
MPSLTRNRHKPSTRSSSERDVWTASRFVSANPPEVLRSLTDPELIGTWAPIDFEVDGLRGRRLRAGSQAWVNGSLAGVAAEFEIEVLRADEHGLTLSARGPVGLDVDYRIAPADTGVMVQAEITLQRERGLSGRVLRAATGALLSGGALDRALRRLAGELTDIDEFDEAEFALAA